MTTKQAAHTPGPLRVYGGLLNGYGIVGEHGNIYSTNDARPLQIFNGQTEAANARRIVQCWNSHDALLEACRDALAHLDQRKVYDIAALRRKLRAATAAAEEA